MPWPSLQFVAVPLKLKESGETTVIKPIIGELKGRGAPFNLAHGENDWVVIGGDTSKSLNHAISKFGYHRFGEQKTINTGSSSTLGPSVFCIGERRINKVKRSMKQLDFSQDHLMELKSPQ